MTFPMSLVLARLLAQPACLCPRQYFPSDVTDFAFQHKPPLIILMMLSNERLQYTQLHAQFSCLRPHCQSPLDVTALHSQRKLPHLMLLLIKERLVKHIWYCTESACLYHVSK